MHGLFRRGMRHPGDRMPAVEFLKEDFIAQVADLVQGNTRDQNVALIRAIEHAERNLTRLLEAIMHTLEDTLAAVQAEKTSEDSLIALCTGIKKQLDDALGGTLTPSQQMRVDAIFNAITDNKSAVDAAVTANTSTGTTPPPVLIPTHTSMTSSLNPANAGDSITLSAALDTHPDAPVGAPAPTGVMTFFDGTTSLGSATMDSTGVAALASSAFAGGNLTAGSHSLHATYAGDAVYATSHSVELVQTISTPPAQQTAPQAAQPSA